MIPELEERQESDHRPEVYNEPVQNSPRETR